MSREESPAHSGHLWPECAVVSLPDDIPTWCRVRQGRSAVLFVAPHGGIRTLDRPTSGAVKVNDLHTADLAAELATGLDAGLIANSELDRNVLDLNRISQVTRRAAWFPVVLERLIAAILERHERAEVVFVHGWNVAQAKCDIGIGHPLDDEATAAAHASRLTASPGYVASRLAALRRCLAARGILAPFGERYPGRHANNVLQLFRRDRPPEPSAPRLAEWSAAGRVEATQLELGLPLRWPGPLRRAFNDAVRETFVGTGGPAVRRPSRPVVHSTAAAVALQTYDRAAGIGLMARIDPVADGNRVSGRVLLFLPDGRVALFTGDDPQTARLSGGGPHAELGPDGLRITFDGWLLATDDGSRYLDLEQALAASDLLALRFDLRFAAHHDDYGMARGTIEIDGRTQPIDAVAFARPAAAIAGHRWLRALTLHAGVDDGQALYVRHFVPGHVQVRELADRQLRSRRCHELSIHCDRDPHAPRRIAVAVDGGDLSADPIHHLAVIRPLAPSRRARVTLGIARIRRGEAVGVGFYEYARVLI